MALCVVNGDNVMEKGQSGYGVIMVSNFFHLRFKESLFDQKGADIYIVSTNSGSVKIYCWWLVTFFIRAADLFASALRLK